MSTTSTLPAVKAGLVAKFKANTSVAVTYAWPGPESEHEAIFFGRHPQSQFSSPTRGEHEIPNLKAGRKQRSETYELELTIWVFRPDLDPTQAETCEKRAFEIAKVVENVLADDPTAGLTDVQWITVGPWVSDLQPFQPGWACDLVTTLSVQARLT